MKILHTGDLHITDVGDQRWEALIQVLSITREEKADVLVISGDLFNSDTDADALRVPLRSLFDGAEFTTLIIPGNHDSNAYDSGLFFGERVRALSEADWSKNIVDIDDVRFIGIPFEEISAQEFRQRLWQLENSIDSRHTNVLIYHGELLDASYERDAFGHESGRYMPSRLSFYEELGVDYVLAGHFHVNFDVWEIGENSFYVYPGSPTSITRKEVGKRQAALIEVGGSPRPIPLDTHHYERLEITLNAFEENNPLEAIAARLRSVDSAATLILSIGGTITGDEAHLVGAVNDAIANLAAEPPEYGFRDISRVVNHPIFELFTKKVNAQQNNRGAAITDEEAKQLREIVIQAIAEAQI